MPKLAGRFVLIVAAILASASLSPSAIVKAQSTKERETFDVASIRRASSTSNRLMRGEPSGFTATDVTALDLIKYAFEVIERDVVGELRGWVKTTRFDVVARTANGPLTARRLGAMTRALLADRFHDAGVRGNAVTLRWFRSASRR